MRTPLKAASWILSAALLATLPQAATAQAPEKSKIAVATASLGLPYLPLIIAQQRKYFADEGLEGEIDAIINSDPVMTKLETDGAIRIIAETRTRKGTEDLFGGPYPEAGLYATADFIAKNPNTIQALTNAIVRAELWMQNATIDDIAANVPAEHMLGDKELYLASYRKMHESHAPDGQITKEGAQIVLNVLTAFLPAVKAANIKVEDTYDNHFVEAALKKFQGKM